MLYAAEPLASDSEDEKQESKSLRNENKAGNVRPQNKNFFEHPKNPLPKLKSTLQVALNHVGKLSPPPSQIKGQHVFAAESQDTLPENADPQIPALLCRTVQPTTQTISQTSVCEVTDEQLFIERNLFYSSGEHSATVVKERLRSNLKFGKNIGASTWVIDIIRDGYCFPFLEKPIILHVITTLILFQRNSKYLFLQGL